MYVLVESDVTWLRSFLSDFLDGLIDGEVLFDLNGCARLDDRLDGLDMMDMDIGINNK